jgi:hypothetical protein
MALAVVSNSNPFKLFKKNNKFHRYYIRDIITETDSYKSSKSAIMITTITL